MMSDWWKDVEDALLECSEHAPDPWVALADAPITDQLTDQQRAFLQQLAEQPDPPRLSDD